MKRIYTARFFVAKEVSWDEKNPGWYKDTFQKCGEARVKVQELPCVLGVFGRRVEATPHRHSGEWV